MVVECGIDSSFVFADWTVVTTECDPVVEPRGAAVKSTVTVKYRSVGEDVSILELICVSASELLVKCWSVVDGGPVVKYDLVGRMIAVFDCGAVIAVFECGAVIAVFECGLAMVFERTDECDPAVASNLTVVCEPLIVVSEPTVECGAEMECNLLAVCDPTKEYDPTTVDCSPVVGCDITVECSPLAVC